MAHHGSNPMEGMNSEGLKNLFDKHIEAENVFRKQMSSEKADKINDLLQQEKVSLGATGNFPDGKIIEQDEGEIMIGITEVEGRVVINFGKPVHWVGLTKQQAVEIAQSLILHSKSDDKQILTEDTKQ